MIQTPLRVVVVVVVASRRRAKARRRRAGDGAGVAREDLVVARTPGARDGEDEDEDEDDRLDANERA